MFNILILSKLKEKPSAIFALSYHPVICGQVWGHMVSCLHCEYPPKQRSLLRSLKTNSSSGNLFKSFIFPRTRLEVTLLYSFTLDIFFLSKICVLLCSATGHPAASSRIPFISWGKEEGRSRMWWGRDSVWILVVPIPLQGCQAGPWVPRRQECGQTFHCPSANLDKVLDTVLGLINCLKGKNKWRNWRWKH